MKSPAFDLQSPRPFFAFGAVVAHGTVAIGVNAYGVVAIGVNAVGGIAIGLNAVGSFCAIGANAVAPIALGGFNRVGAFEVPLAKRPSTSELLASLAVGSWRPSLMALAFVFVWTFVYAGYTFFQRAVTGTKSPVAKAPEISPPARFTETAIVAGQPVETGFESAELVGDAIVLRDRSTTIRASADRQVQDTCSGIAVTTPVIATIVMELQPVGDAGDFREAPATETTYTITALREGAPASAAMAPARAPLPVPAVNALGAALVLIATIAAHVGHVLASR